MINKDTKKMTPEECKRILVKTLSAFDQICKENNLKYYLIYGTLLGAVRHHGFIPWDDDIDIAMPRDDYSRLVEISKKWNRPYTFFCAENNDGYPLYFGKFCGDETIIKNIYVRDVEHLGLYIDVFPIDPIGVNEENLSYIRKWLARNEKMINFSSMKKCWPSESLLKTVAKAFAYICSKLIGTKRLLRIRSSFLATRNANMTLLDSKYCICGSTVLRTEWVLEVIQMPFENKLYLCPIGYDGYLKAQYGNYMELPPIEKRVARHDYEAYWA